MPYNNVISAADAAPLIPVEAAQQIITATAQQSAAMQLCRTVRMSSKTFQQPVLSAAPVAYWVAAGAMKQTSEAAWQGVVLTAEEIAVVVPVDDNVLADAEFPIWDELTAPLGQAFAKVLDDAVFAGTNKPASWPTALIPGATAAGNTNVADSTAADGGVVNDLGETMDDVEDDGFEVTGFAAARRLKQLLRKSRSTTGESLGEATTTRVWDVPIAYAVAGSFPATALALAGDFSMAVLGVRQEMRIETFNTGVITDAAGVIQFNLLQQDMTAVRCTARFGFAVAVPVTLAEAGSGTPYPFSVLTTA